MDPTACERATQHASQPSVTDGQAKAERKKVTWLCPHKSSEKRTWGFSNLNDSVGFCIAPSSIQALALFFFIRPLRTCFIWNNPESHGRHEAENWLVEGISNQWIQVWKLPPESSSPSLAVTGTRVINHLNPGRFTKYPLCCIRQQRDCRASHHSFSPMHNFLEPTLCSATFCLLHHNPMHLQSKTPPHTMMPATVFASSSLPQVAKRSSFPQQDATWISINANVSIDTMQTREQTSFSMAGQRGVGNSCHLFL